MFITYDRRILPAANHQASYRKAHQCQASRLTNERRNNCLLASFLAYDKARRFRRDGGASSSRGHIARLEIVALIAIIPAIASQTDNVGHAWHTFFHGALRFASISSSGRVLIGGNIRGMISVCRSSCERKYRLGVYI